MHNLCKLCIVTFLILLIFSSVEAQTNPVYLRMQQYKLSGSEDRLKKIGATKYDARTYSSLGYDDTTLINLKKIGIDLLNLAQLPSPWNEKIFTALSDCIIIGTVSRIEHPEGKPWFRTVAYVQIEQFIRNDYNLIKSEIPVLIVSAPGHTLVGEDTLGTGEHVLLFLSASSLIDFASYNNMDDLYNKIINDSSIKFGMIAKYDIKSEKITYRNREGNLTKVKENINTVLMTVHSNLSTAK